MTVGKLFEFATKPEQPGFSSSIRLEVMIKRTWYVKILLTDYWMGTNLKIRLIFIAVFIYTQLLNELS